MLTHRDLASRLHGLRIEQEHPGAAPERDVERLAVARDERRVGLRGQGHGLEHAAAAEVDPRQQLAEHVHREELRAVRGDGDPPHEALPGGARQHEGALQGQRALDELVLAHAVVAGARGVEHPPARAPGEAEPGVVHRELGLHVHVAGVDHGEGGLRPPVAADDDVPAVRGLDHGQGQVTDRQVPPGRGDAPAVRQERHVARLLARPAGIFRRGAGDGERAGGGEERHQTEAEGWREYPGHCAMLHLHRASMFPQHCSRPIE